MVERVLGERFEGVLVTDFYAAYGRLDADKQKCLTHLLRELHTLRNELPQAAVDAFIQPGQRSLSRDPRQDFEEGGVVPAAAAAVHGYTFLILTLLQQRQREAIQPRQILAHEHTASPRFVLAIGHV